MRRKVSTCISALSVVTNGVPSWHETKFFSTVRNTGALENCMFIKSQRAPCFVGERKELLDAWVSWLCQQKYGLDALTDFDGKRTEELNKLRNDLWKDVWFVASAWGNAFQYKRTIRLPKGKSLFVVLASSHATPPEVSPGEDLMSHAEKVHELWKTKNLTLNGKQATTQRLKTLSTTYVDPENYIALYLKTSGNIPIATVADACVFKPEELAGADKNPVTIALNAHSPASNEEPKEPTDYRMNVNYKIMVTQ